SRRQFDLDVFGAIARQQSNTIAAAEATRRQHRRHALNAAEQLAVTHLPALIFDRDAVRLNSCAAAEQFADCRARAGYRSAVGFASHCPFTPRGVFLLCRARSPAQNYTLAVVSDQT